MSVEGEKSKTSGNFYQDTLKSEKKQELSWSASMTQLVEHVALDFEL